MKRNKVVFDRNQEESKNEKFKKELARLVEENTCLENLIGFNSLRFKDVLIYCKKTMDEQDELIRRLEDSIERNHLEYNKKLQLQFTKIEQEEKEFKNEIEKLQTDNWLMKTQLNTREEMDSEVKILQAHFEELQKVVKEKDEIISKAELKEREISILAAERTRKELEAEFDLQIQRIEKELRIQNAAQIQANHQIVKKMQNEIEKHAKEKEDLSSKFSKLKEDFEETKIKLVEAEDQKRKMENTIQRSNQQTEKLLKETKRQLEDSEKSRQKEAAKLNAVINGLRKENSELKIALSKFEKEKQQMKIDLENEQKIRHDTLTKHSAQNARLEDLRKFLSSVLEENNDDYIDNIIGENRAAVFAKLSLLLQRIPVVE